LNELEQAYQECRAITRREARTFYFAFLTLPAARRKAIYVAYAFCRHCDDAVDTNRSTQDKMALLLNMRESLDQMYHGHTTEALYLALADVVERYDIPQQYLQDVMAGVESDLVKNRYQNFEELRRYCYQVASSVGLICLQIFGYKDSDAKARAIDLGLAMQLTNIIRDVREDLELDRIYLPQDEMAQFHYTEAALRSGQSNESFTALMQFQAQRARFYFQSGLQLPAYLTPRSRACPAVLGQLYSKLLDRIEIANFDVLHHQIGLNTADKLWLTARTWLTCTFPQRPIRQS
jgi:phytoene synthase